MLSDTFVAIAGSELHLSNDSPVGRILHTMVSAGEFVANAALIDAGWPGEKMQEKAALNRLRVAVAKLRKAGFDFIETESGGYRVAEGRVIARALAR